jgi:hypothetical protein
MADGMKPVVGHWVSKIQLAIDHKKREFQDDADECSRFLDGPYDWLYKPRGPQSGGFDIDEMDMKTPSVRMTINKTAELVQLFGPAIYHRNPVRKVSPREVLEPPPELFGDVQADPMAAAMMQQTMVGFQQQQAQDRMRAQLLEKYLNYTPTALDLKTHSRWAMTEALIKGMGVQWVSPHTPPGSTNRWVGSFYDSVDNLLLDPDATNIKDIKWCARRRCKPVWEVEREFGYAPGTLNGTAGVESHNQQAAVMNDPEGDYRRKQGRTADLMVYWEVYSKMGLGGRLRGLDQSMRERFDLFGDFCYLAIAEHIPYPLNIPPPLCDAFESLEMAQAYAQPISQRVQWETPYWADNSWPFGYYAFHFRPGHLWPMSHLKPGMGELKFLNWAWSFLAAKVRIASRDFIAIAKAAGEDIKDKIKHGSDYTVIEVENILGAIDNVVKFLQHPGFNPEIYRVIEAVTQQFDKRVGLTELMYGQSARQMRSAQEAQLKSDAINVRPDDMANSAEDTMTDLSRKEAFCARWHLKGQDVVSVVGPTGAQLWDSMLVMSDPSVVIYGLEYRIEANSARKPNKAKEAEDMQQLMQNLFPSLWQYAQQTGDVNPVNALLSDLGNSIDRDTAAYLINPPPPPPAPAEGEGGPPPEGAPPA